MYWENSLCWIYVISGNAYQYRLIRLRVIGNAAESGLNNTTTANSNFSKWGSGPKRTVSESKAGSHFAPYRRADLVDLEAPVTLVSEKPSQGQSLLISFWTRQLDDATCAGYFGYFALLGYTFLPMMASFSWLQKGYHSAQSLVVTTANTVELACAKVSSIWMTLILLSAHFQTKHFAQGVGIYCLAFVTVAPLHEPVFTNFLHILF